MRALFSSVVCLALLGCGLGQRTYRADNPVFAEAASHTIDIPFPSSAKDVYYVLHAGGMQEFQMFVRFSVDPKDLDTAASDIFSDHDKKMKVNFSSPTLSLASAPRSPAFTALQPMPWWSPESITSGFYRGSTNGQPFHVWADISQHTIYLCTHD